MNNTITPHTAMAFTMDYYTTYIATTFMTAWVWMLMAWMVTWNNMSTSAVTPPTTTLKTRSNWLIHGIITRPDGKNTHLYERTYPSGKKAWRYLDECDQWVYPRRRDLESTATNS